jgi:hypothetical protein
MVTPERSNATGGRPESMTPSEQAEKLIEAAIALLADEAGIPRGDAGRTLLGAIARWFGIDFAREVERVETQE